MQVQRQHRCHLCHFQLLQVLHPLEPQKQLLAEAHLISILTFQLDIMEVQLTIKLVRLQMVVQQQQQVLQQLELQFPPELIRLHYLKQYLILRKLPQAMFLAALQEIAQYH